MSATQRHTYLLSEFQTVQRIADMLWIKRDDIHMLGMFVGKTSNFMFIETTEERINAYLKQQGALSFIQLTGTAFYLEISGKLIKVEGYPKEDLKDTYYRGNR